ncbi:hypothetical protein HanLR1_Chr12g0457771 [Helianthus annuus]|nr:hypothetical protein HanLR1_Chr12g0457771 [Helianthus annuus]
MGKKKKTPPPKVYNTRSTTKEEVAVIKEQVASWWDKLISGNVESSGAVEKKDEVSTVEKTGECGLSKSVSTVPTVSASDYSSEKVASSIVGSSEKMVTSESSGSSYTVAGDESVNSSPSVVKKPDESSIRNPKFASVFDVLDYNKRNLSIPTKSSSPMNIREHFMVAAGVKTSENLSGSSSRIIDKFCGNDVTSAGNDGDCRKAAVKADNLKNPNDSCPLDDVANGQMECSVVGLNHVATELENIAKVGSAVDLDQVNSPSGVSPGMFTSVDTSPNGVNEDPSQATALPSAAATGSTNDGLQNDTGPVNDNNPTGIDKLAMNISNRPADKVKSKKRSRSVIWLSRGFQIYLHMW